MQGNICPCSGLVSGGNKAITLTNDEQDLYRYMASIIYNVLTQWQGTNLERAQDWLVRSNNKTKPQNVCVILSMY